METTEQKNKFNGKQLAIWLIALVIGLGLGTLHCDKINGVCDFIASIYTRLFQFLAVPTIALTILTTLATLGPKKSTGRIFLHTIKYTLLTTFAAATIGAILFKIIKPANLSKELILKGMEKVPEGSKALSYADHLLSVVPNNILEPLLKGNVLSILIMASAIGLALAVMKQNEKTQILLKGILGMQDVLFALIRALVWSLPLGVVAFSAQLSAQMAGGVIFGSLGKYAAVVIGGNLIQFFIVLPLFLICRGVNPVKVFRAILPAILMALFTKSSAATLPVNIACAENNLKARPAIVRFILPICCTINMNGCAAFILVTSLFLLQNAGMAITLPVILLWIFIAVFSAVGNAGVPMGCYFLTLSLMTGMGAPIGILGVILPLYTMIDMIETAINISSDACICAIVDKHLVLPEADAPAIEKA